MVVIVGGDLVFLLKKKPKQQRHNISDGRNSSGIDNQQ